MSNLQFGETTSRKAAIAAMYAKLIQIMDRHSNGDDGTLAAAIERLQPDQLERLIWSLLQEMHPNTDDVYAEGKEVGYTEGYTDGYSAGSQGQPREL